MRRFWHGAPVGPYWLLCLASFATLGHAAEVFTYDDNTGIPGLRDEPAKLSREVMASAPGSAIAPQMERTFISAWDRLVSQSFIAPATAQLPARPSAAVAVEQDMRLCSSRFRGRRMERRLTAILAAGVVGYSRQTGEDEAVTISRLWALRAEVIEPLLAEHCGRLFKDTGDGFLPDVLPNAIHH